jgi:hypothetical protein
VAEREGFEPSRAINPGSFQDCCLQPLGHLSLGKTSRITPSACASAESRLTVGFTYRSTTFNLQHGASGAILNVLRLILYRTLLQQFNKLIAPRRTSFTRSRSKTMSDCIHLNLCLSTHFVRSESVEDHERLYTSKPLPLDSLRSLGAFDYRCK